MSDKPSKEFMELIEMCRRHPRLMTIANRCFDRIDPENKARAWMTHPTPDFIELVTTELREIDALMTAGVM